MAYTKLERDAETSFYMGRPAIYDLRADEFRYLRDIIRGCGDDRGIYKAITDAYNAGFTRGARAAARGRLHVRKRNVTRSK